MLLIALQNRFWWRPKAQRFLCDSTCIRRAGACKINPTKRFGVHSGISLPPSAIPTPRTWDIYVRYRGECCPSAVTCFYMACIPVTAWRANMKQTTLRLVKSLWQNANRDVRQRMKAIRISEVNTYCIIVLVHNRPVHSSRDISTQKW